MTDKHAGGRPRKFESVEAMDVAVEAYFDKCDKNSTPCSMSGLAYELGVTRHTLINYKDRCDEFGNEFLPTIARARARVERDLEEGMYAGIGSARGREFGLKNNFDWRDKQELDVRGNVSVHFDKKDEEL